MKALILINSNNSKHVLLGNMASFDDIEHHFYLTNSYFIVNNVVGGNKNHPIEACVAFEELTNLLVFILNYMYI